MMVLSRKHVLRLVFALLALLLLVIATTAQAQQRPASAAMPAPAKARSAAMPAPSVRQSESAPQQTRTILLSDGTVLADFGGGYERLIRSCAAYGGEWPATHARVADRAPQMGTGSRPPGANGLPPAPGLSPVPGGGGTTPAAQGTSSSTLQPMHSGWRRGGRTYYDGACYLHDRYGRLRLIRL